MASVSGHPNGLAKAEEAMTPEASNRNGASDGMATSAGGAAMSMEGGADSGEGADGKRRKKPGSRNSGEKGKGLRHFSLKVCEKVESKGRTTYNEVADELVAEITGPGQQLLPKDQHYDEKNIRRRVYDALNVLMAMDIISKEKKEIKWKGLPPSSGSQEMLQHEKRKVEARLEKKRQSHQELQEQVTGIERLIQRNEANFANGGVPPGSGVGLPFILVQTRPQATVEVEISEDMQLVHFDFGSTPFELHDDSFVLRAMGLANRPLEDVLLGPPGSLGASGTGAGAGAAAAPGQQAEGGYATGMPGSGQVDQAMVQGAMGGGVPVPSDLGQGPVYQQVAGVQPRGGPEAQHYVSAPSPFPGGAQYGPARGGGNDGAVVRGPDQYAEGPYGMAQYQQQQVPTPAQQMYGRMPMYQQAAPQDVPPASRGGGFTSQQPVGSYQPGAMFYQQGGAPGPAR